MLHSTVYNAWRQMFFVYPAFLLISMTGLHFLLHWIENISQSWFKKTSYLVLTGFILWGTFDTAAFMIRNHPNQNMFFNCFVGGTKGAKGQFEMDYWGTTYKQALEFILNHDSGKIIPVYVNNSSGKVTAMILRPHERKRIRYTKTKDEAKYFVSNFKNDEHRKNSFKNKIYSINIEGAEILAVYKLK